MDGPATDEDGPGTSIGELLSQAGVTPASATYANVSVASGQPSRLTGTTHDFDPSPNSAFVDGLVPIFYPVGDSLGYVRPLRADKPDDTNATEFLQVPRGGAFTVQVHLSGALLHPTLTAADTTIRVGQSVRLSASVSDPMAEETLDWMWNLANGTNDVDTGGTPTLTTPRYTTPGTYYVQASVTGSRGSSGESNTVAITVTSQGKTPTPRTTGPGRGAGTSKNPIGGPVTGGGSRYNGRPGVSPTATGGPVSPRATGSPAASASASASASAASDPASAGASATRTPPLARPSGGQLVAGFALVDPAGATSANQPTAAAPAAAAAARAGGQPVRASLAWAGLACIIALLLAGAGLERRRSFPGPKRRHR